MQKEGKEAGSERELSTVAHIKPAALYKVDEIAVILRCGKTNVYDLLRRGDLASTRIGTGRMGLRVMGSDLLAFLESRKEGGPKPQGTFKFLKLRT